MILTLMCTDFLLARRVAEEPALRGNPQQTVFVQFHHQHSASLWARKIPLGKLFFSSFGKQTCAPYYPYFLWIGMDIRELTCVPLYHRMFFLTSPSAGLLTPNRTSHEAVQFKICLPALHQFSLLGVISWKRKVTS